MGWFRVFGCSRLAEARCRKSLLWRHSRKQTSAYERQENMQGDIFSKSNSFDSNSCKFMLNFLHSDTSFNWTWSFYLPLQLYMYLHMRLINIWFAIQSDRQTGNTRQTSQRGKTWLTFKLDFPGHFCQRAGFTILAIFGFLVLSFGFKVHLGHVGFLSFTICERKSEANALLQMCDLLSHS